MQPHGNSSPRCLIRAGMIASHVILCTKWAYILVSRSLVSTCRGSQSTEHKLTSTVAECLDLVCRQSSKDATLLYACVLEAKGSGNRREAIMALNKILEKYDHAAPADVHLPTLLRSVLGNIYVTFLMHSRMTARLLMSELIKDGGLSLDVVEQICTVFEGGAYVIRSRTAQLTTVSVPSSKSVPKEAK
jgi:hypothetical protein